MDRAIVVDNLRVTYGTFVAVNGLSFSVGFGEVLGLLGPNGAGKTSTIESMEGYIKPASGSVKVLGLDPFANQAKLARQMGVMLQEGGIPPRMTVKEALELYSRFYDDPVPPADLAERLELSSLEKTSFRRLSGGEKQRLLLALAIVGKPKVLFLDEPTAGVDPVGKVTIRELVSELSTAGMAIILSGHELEEIDRMVDRVMIISHGEEIACGTPDELKAQFGREAIEVQLVESSSGLDIEMLSTKLSTSVERIERGKLRILTQATPSEIQRISAVLEELGLSVASIQTESSTLESIYLQLIRGGEN
jgi:ABC-2 type transport system ATP-binding protein